MNYTKEQIQESLYNDPAPVRPDLNELMIDLLKMEHELTELKKKHSLCYRQLKNFTMRNLARKMGFMCVVLAIIPIATFANMIGKAAHIDSAIIVSIQLPALAVQLFSMFLMIRYRREIF